MTLPSQSSTEWIRPHDLLTEVLPPIPPSITTREQFSCNTVGMIWRLSPTLGLGIIDWNKILTTPRTRDIKSKEGKLGIIRRNGILVSPTSVGLSHLVLGWLAWNYGDRPGAFRKLRESHFEFYESRTVIVGQVRLPESEEGAQITMPESKQRHADYLSTQDPLPLDDNLTRLVPELIAQNRAQRERLGKDNTLDWPLFTVVQEGRGSFQRKRSALPHDDLTQNEQLGSSSMNRRLKLLFEVLQVPDGKGGVIVPTFYSFRDGMVTNMQARGVPLEVIAALHNKGLRALAPYNKPGISFVKTLDEVPEFSETAAAFEFAEPVREREVPKEEALPYFDVDGTLFGKFGRCGCIGAPCPIAFNGSMDCYLCPAFQAIVEGPHARVYERLWQIRTAMREAELPQREYTRYDSHLAAITGILKRIHLMEEAAQ